MPLERRIELPRNTNSSICVHGRALSDPPRAFMCDTRAACISTLWQRQQVAERLPVEADTHLYMTYSAEIRPRGYLPSTTTIRALGMAFVQAAVIVKQ